MASQVPLDGSELIDCAKANSEQNIEIAVALVSISIVRVCSILG
jgi:hypothetical protein